MIDEQKKVYEIISRKLGVPENELHENADLRHDLNAQKIEIADLLMELEKEFQMHFSKDEVSEVHTIGHILDIVHGE